MDYFGILDGSEDTAIFVVPGTFVWVKPRGSKMVHLVAMGGGGGGRGGSSGSGGQEGGGGGSSAGIASVIIPAVLLPDRLYVRVGAGGAGGAAGAGSGSNGGDSIISLLNLGDATSYVLLGIHGNGATARTGAADAGTTDTTSNYFAELGIYDAIPGDNGSNGGVNTGTNGLSVNNNRGRSGGAGGGGCAAAADFTGGSVSIPSSLAQKPDRPFFSLSGGIAGGGNGLNGVALTRPFLFYGGSGGGSNFAGTGGNGGNGAYGCGGGGGGAGVTGGIGGTGGNGLVMISVW